uniref:Malate synthase n=1 Tax=Nephromyces sp. MMRI TaxID=2496275 RepID=A0A3Q8UBU3_9APIC|nr:malate synthase [Nephromyces sp. MMRI]
MQSVVMHLRALLQTQPARCVCLPGAFNGFVGRLCAETGFKACYLSGGALSASCGIPDTGILERSRFVAAVKEISRASKLPILADADTGFGTHIDTYETVRLYHEAGASGFHIEDQVFPKRCGHLAGKELVPLEEFCNKIKAACRARDECTQGQFIICARTDARSVLGLDEALERGKAYAELGADMLFPEGLETEVN